MNDTPIQRVLKALVDAGCGPRRAGPAEWQARCPAHEDRNPSLAVGEGSEGRALVCCHAGCDLDSVLLAARLTPADLFPANGHKPLAAKEIVATYKYVDEHNHLLFEVVRYAPKDFRQRRPDGNGGWDWRLGDTRRVVYRLPQVVAAVAAGEPVLVVEGERDVHAVEAAGEVATCNPGGAGKWRPEYTATCAGADVIVVADRDAPGRAHARAVAAALRPVAASVRLVEPAEGKDVADHLAAGHSLEELLYLDETAEDVEEPAPFPDVGSASTSRDRERDDWPVLDPAAFHGLAGRVVRALGPHSEADPAGLLLTFLAFFGSAVGAGPHAVADGSVHPLRLFVALVGDTSRSRKGTTSSRTRSVFEHADPTWTYNRVMSGFGSGEAIVDEVRDPKMGTDKAGEPVVVDQGVEDKRLLVLEGEFARILAVAAREGSTVSAIMRDAWDLGRLAARARQQKSVATGAHVSFVVNITVEELRRRLSETEMANGLANRFLFGCVRRSKLLPGGGHMDPDELHRIGAEVRSALEAARKISVVRRTETAEKRWAEMYAEMANGPRGLLGAITARAEAQTLRLSVGYALLDGKPEVEEAHLEAAYALWKFCEASAAHTFGDALGDDVADRLLEAIRDAGDAGLDFTGQTEVFGRHVGAKRLTAARAELQQLGLISTTAEQTGGRPRMVSHAVRDAK